LQGETGHTGPAGIISAVGTFYGDYLYWSTISNNWQVGSGNINIGAEAGENNQGLRSIALGDGAGKFNQGNDSIAIGDDAGNSDQGGFSIAIGYKAGYTGQAANSIILNAQSFTELNSQNSGFFVAPIRAAGSSINNYLGYNTDTKEIFSVSGAGPTGLQGATGATGRIARLNRSDWSWNIFTKWNKLWRLSLLGFKHIFICRWRY
jgi:hypothetical protein